MNVVMDLTVSDVTLVKSLHTKSSPERPLYSLPIVLPSSSAPSVKIEPTQDLKVKSAQKQTVPKA